MRKPALLLLAAISVISAHAAEYSFKFHNSPISKALVEIGKKHPELNISFIYKDLDNYRTTAIIETDNAYEALQKAIGNNPIILSKRGDSFYVEAMQHGKFQFTGRTVDTDNAPVISATVMLLSPNDSTVITYGVTDDTGRFAIPCDHRKVIAKFSCIGYKTEYQRLNSFAVGNIVMHETSISLANVTVESNNAFAQSDKTVYLPGSRQKDAAHNLVDLLRFMSIPQINVNAVDNSVTNNAGSVVSLYINGMPATPQDIDGIPTADVRRVEYLEAPSDPRFQGETQVVNFIVQEYAYGGYTKASVSENFLAGLARNGSVFSKFNYGKMSYDFYVAANNTDSKHIGNSTTEDYLLRGPDGSENHVRREEVIEKSDYKHNQYPVTFRATYNTDKIQIRNTLGYSNDNTPEHSVNGNVIIDGTESGYKRSNPARKNTLSYSGLFNFSLPDNYSIDFTPTFNFTHTNDRLAYSTADKPMITRDAKENAYTTRLKINGRKRFDSHHSVLIGLDGLEMRNSLKYSGTNHYDDAFSIIFAGGTLGYTYRNSKISVNTKLGINWEHSDINGKTLNTLYPSTHILLQYSPNQRNHFSGYFQIASDSPTISDKASDILQDNEYLYITGNPGVKNARIITGNIAYSWLANNIFKMSVFGVYFGSFDRLITVYSPYNNGSAIIRNYLNDGNYTGGDVGVSLVFTLFNGKLQLRARPIQNFYKSSGYYDCLYKPFTLTADATLYLGKFYLIANYISPERELKDKTNAIYRKQSFYQVGAGWSHKNWKIRLTANNLFNSGWTSVKSNMSSQYYSSTQTEYGTKYHQYLNFSVSYIVNYGKKVQQGNEVGEQSGASSAILK